MSQYTVASSEQAGHGSHVAECVEGGEGRPRSSLSCHAHAMTTPSAADKASCGMVTPLQSSKVRLTRKNSFSEAMGKHVKETGGKPCPGPQVATPFGCTLYARFAADVDVSFTNSIQAIASTSKEE